MINSKKTQIAGQILIYVLAIIIFSLTLLYGYKAVKYFTDKSTEISFLQLEKDITTEIEKVQGDSFGTIKKKVLTIPGNYKHVCFIQSYPKFPSAHFSLGLNYDLIDNHINSGAIDSNMFLAPPGHVSFYIGDIEVEGQSKCINIIGGKITLRLESMGNHVKLSEW